MKGNSGREHLRDGTPITLMRLTQLTEPGDKPWLKARISEGYDQLSPRSRRQRFISPPPRLSDSQLDYLSELDPARCAVWVARDDSLPEPAGIGLARYMRIPDTPENAEIALTVIDRYQNRGMGRIFLRCLADYARNQGTACLIGYVLPENKPMLHLFRSLGARAPLDEGGLLRVDWVMEDASSAVP